MIFDNSFVTGKSTTLQVKIAGPRKLL